MADRELVVAEDVTAAAVGVFTALSPRTIALAGGETPQPFHRAIAEVGHDWASTDVFFGDERCVPPDHDASNFRKAQEALLSKVPARVHRMPGESCDAAAYERALVEVFGEGRPPSLDLVVLGIGEDGHTASLFPGDPALEERERLAVRVERPDYSRLTLTLPVLNAAGVVMFLIDNQGKREALRRMLEDGDVPASLVAAERVVVLAHPAAAP